MVEHHFDDGTAYERMIGTWSRLAGEVFLDWLAVKPGLRWIDIGCGNGCFTELLVYRCRPAEVVGIDRSEGQLAFARERPGARQAEFRIGNAMSLPYANDSFDAAVMALVVFFLPEPLAGVREMARIVCPGGIVSSYSWDILGGGFPLEPIRIGMAEMGVTLPLPPSAAASRMEALNELWHDAGLEAIETREITIERAFRDFDEFWSISQGSSAGIKVAEMPSADVDRLKSMVAARLPIKADGQIVYPARANAIVGRVPG